MGGWRAGISSNTDPSLLSHLAAGSGFMPQCPWREKAPGLRLLRVRACRLPPSSQTPGLCLRQVHLSEAAGPSVFWSLGNWEWPRWARGLLGLWSSEVGTGPGLGRPVCLEVTLVPPAPGSPQPPAWNAPECPGWNSRRRSDYFLEGCPEILECFFLEEGRGIVGR